MTDTDNVAQNTEGMKTSGDSRCWLILAAAVINELNVGKWKVAFSAILQPALPLAAHMRCRH